MKSNGDRELLFDCLFCETDYHRGLRESFCWRYRRMQVHLGVAGKYKRRERR